ncbi:hypothetical protein ACROYT_G003403 [Oculina patagonica]
MAWYKIDRINVKVNTNNGIERKNKSFKYEFLEGNRDMKLSGLLAILVTQFLPQSFKKYEELNIRSSSSYRLYNTNVPVWLRDRPREFVAHCMGRLSNAMETPVEDIQVVGGGKFKVKSQTDPKEYTLNFSNEVFPSCECEDWKKNHWPCKHFMAIFINFEEWGWYSLPAVYRENPYFSLDPSIVKAGLAQESYTIAESKKSASLNPQNMEDETLEEEQLSLSKNFKESAMTCREYLNQIKDLTYLCENHQILEETGQLLNNILVDFRKKLETEDGILLKKRVAKRGQSLTRPSTPTSRLYSEIPSRNKRKRKTNRNGKSQKKA